MARTRSWDELYQNMDGLTCEDKADIDLTVQLAKDMCKAKKDAGFIDKTLAVVDIPASAGGNIR